MPEEIQEQAQTAEPQGEAKTQTDWKAEARKWEERAKKSLAAEEELAKLKQAQMTEQEKAIARAEEAETKLAQLEAEKARADAARRISGESGVPLSLLEFCTDEAAMEKFAALYKESQPQPEPIHAAARADGSRIVRNSGEQVSSKEAFMRFAAEQFNR